MLFPIALTFLILYLISAVVFFRRGGAERVLSGLVYKTFVARRYLLVPHPKVTRLTKWMIVGGFVFRLGCQIAFAAGVGAANYHNPLWDLERASEAFLLAVIVGGVLVHSKPALYAFIFGAVVTSVGGALNAAKTYNLIYAHQIGDAVPSWFGVVVLALVIGGSILAFLAIFFGMLRAFFTFFTTVPIGGVWIGTMALVCVLSVMSGFESDLREKILGSSAHIQITREDGDFTEWHEIKARVDKLPGVVASTPYAVSEVVIAANNNGMPVIIKGIDPKTIGGVTDLVHDLEDKDSMQRLEPGADAQHDLRVPQTPAKPPKNVIDPPPADMPHAGDPIDYSKGSDLDEPDVPSAPDEPPPLPLGSGVPHAPGGHAIDHAIHGGTPHGLVGAIGADDLEPSAGSAGSAGSDRFGGDAPYLVGDAPVIDPPPPDMVTTDDPPIDYSKPGSGNVDPTIHIVDMPSDQTSLSTRTQALPGILVGRELVKQTHLYTGEEVRLVSPLSDPSNPDATGTPVPFNRDYRVAGIFFTGMYEYDLKYVYVTLDSLQDFLDRGDAVDGIEVRVNGPDDTDEMVEKLNEELGPKYRVQDWKELNHSLFSALKLEKIAMFIVLGIVILVASFSIVGNLIMVVVEKGREIALLKTLGASDAGVMQLFAIQGLFIGLIGTVLGVTTGLVACYVGKRVGIPLNPDVYYIDKMPVHVDPSSVFVTFAAGVLISIAATFYPAILAARVRPAAGMRH